MPVVITYKQKELPVESFTFKCANTNSAILCDVRSHTIYVYKDGKTVFVIDKKDAEAIGNCIINMGQQKV